MREQQYGVRRGDQAVMGRDGSWGRLVSSEAASSDPSSLREAWGRETVVDCARSFQLPVETSRRLWKFRKELRRGPGRLYV